MVQLNVEMTREEKRDLKLECIEQETNQTALVKRYIKEGMKRDQRRRARKEAQGEDPEQGCDTEA